MIICYHIVVICMYDTKNLNLNFLAVQWVQITALSLYMTSKNLNLNFLSSTVAIYSHIASIYDDKKFKFKFFVVYCSYI